LRGLRLQLSRSRERIDFTAQLRSVTRLWLRQIKRHDRRIMVKTPMVTSTVSLLTAARLWSVPDQSARRKGVEPEQASAAAPGATHPGHDHHAAWPKFLQIGRITHPNGVRARVVARVNFVGFR